MTVCPKCGSDKILKKGTRVGKQRYKCNSCGANFTEGVPYKSAPPILRSHNLKCIRCGSSHVVRDGKLLDGTQRYKCVDCNLNFSKKTKLTEGNREEVLKLIFLKGASIEQVVEQTNLSPSKINIITEPFYARENISLEKKKLIIQYGYYLRVPIEYLAEYIPCSRKACERVLSEYREKVNDRIRKKYKNRKH